MGGAFLLFAMVLYHVFYFNSVFPISDGWGVYYAELVDKGAVPYKDFYYYLMPLNLGIDYAFWKLSFGSLLVFRMWYLLQRVFMMLVLYKLLCKFVSPICSAIGCICGLFIGMGQIYDLVGDYNQTEILLVILLSYFLVKFFESTGKNRQRQLFVAGVFLGLIIISKQSTALVAVTFCIALLLSYCIICKESKWLSFSIATVLGALVPLIICCVALLSCGAFLPFVEQVVGAGTAKGGIKLIILATLDRLFLQESIIVTALLMLIVGLTFSIYANRRTRDSFWALLISSIGACYAISLLNGNFTAGLFSVMKTTPLLYIIPIIMIAMLAFVIIKPDSAAARLVRLYQGIPACALLIFTVFAVVMVMSNFETWKLTSIARPSLSAFLYLSGVLMVFAPVLWFYRRARRKTDAFDIRKIPLFVGGAIIYVACSLTTVSSATPTPRFAVFATSVMIALLLSYAKLPRKFFELKNALIMIFCCYISFAFFGQKSASPYIWWGTNSDIYASRTEEVDLDHLRGFKLTAEQKLMYERLTAAIENNSDKDDTVWGFPHVKIFNILTDRYDLSDPVPVLFYDVCSADAARDELEWLKENPPEIIVWCEIEDCLEIHDAAGLDMSGHYELIRWFEGERHRYELVDAVGNVSVLKLVDGE